LKLNADLKAQEESQKKLLEKRLERIKLQKQYNNQPASSEMKSDDQKDMSRDDVKSESPTNRTLIDEEAQAKLAYREALNKIKLIEEEEKKNLTQSLENKKSNDAKKLAERLEKKKKMGLSNDGKIEPDIEESKVPEIPKFTLQRYMEDMKLSQERYLGKLKKYVEKFMAMRMKRVSVTSALPTKAQLAKNLLISNTINDCFIVGFKKKCLYENKEFKEHAVKVCI
jgi:hypothetical protein